MISFLWTSCGKNKPTTLSYCVFYHEVTIATVDHIRNGYISLSNVKDALVVALESSTIISIKTQIQQLLVKLATMEDNERVSFSQFASVVTCKYVSLSQIERM